MASQMTAIGRITFLLVVIGIIVVAFVVAGAVGFLSFGPRSSSTSVCVVAASSTGTYIHVVSDSTQQPIAAASIQVTPVATQCTNEVTSTPVDYNANASGWITIAGEPADVHLVISLAYAARSYNFTLPQRPLTATYATLRLPSGNVSISLCNTFNVPMSCTTYTQATTGMAELHR